MAGLTQFTIPDTIWVGKYDEPILIKSSPDYAWDGNEIVAGVAPIKSDDT